MNIIGYNVYNAPTWEQRRYIGFANSIDEACERLVNGLVFAKSKAPINSQEDSEMAEWVFGDYCIVPVVDF